MISDPLGQKGENVSWALAPAALRRNGLVHRDRPRLEGRLRSRAAPGLVRANAQPRANARDPRWSTFGGEPPKDSRLRTGPPLFRLCRLFGL